MELDTTNQQATPVQNTPQEPLSNTPISNQKGFVPVILGVIVLLVVVAIGSYYLGSKNPSRQLERNTQNVISTPTTSFPNSNPTQVPLVTNEKVQHTYSVNKLQTGFGIDGMPAPTYPATVNVSVPKTLEDQLAAYGASGIVIIAPKGWTGKGSVGADGNSSVTLYPASGFSENGSKLTVFVASTGTGSALWDAVEFNPWVQSHWQELGMPAPAPSPRPGLVKTQVTSHLMKYSLPVNNGFETNGVAFSDAQDHQKDSMWALEKLEVVLPTNQNNLASAIIDAFIQNRGLNNK